MATEQFQSDKIYSTYWWEMTLDPNHPENYSQKVKIMTGYSKRQGHDEARDKPELLMKKILMLQTRGYLQKSIQIVIYKKEGDLLNKSTSIQIIKLRRKDYAIHPDVLSDQTLYNNLFLKGGVITFLSKFYDCITNSKDVKYLLPNKRPTFSKDDYLDITKHSFETRKHLYSYCGKMIINGHPYEAVMHFQRKYEEKMDGNQPTKSEQQ